MMKFRYFFISNLLLVLFVIPAMAGTLYSSGGPDISATIAGTNEFSPGATARVNIMVENRGLIDLKIVRSDIVSRDDLPSTAKLIKVALLENDTPITVKSGHQMIGDVEGGGTKTVAFDVKVDDHAPGGSYLALLLVEYTYLYSAESDGQDNIRYYYKTVERELPLQLNIRPEVRLAVLSAVPEHLDVGAEGYLTLTLKNTGGVYAHNAVARIAQNGQSPIKPTDSSVYIGDFAEESEITTRYKVAISTSAAEYQVYPLDVYLEYKDFEGDAVTSDRVTFGVPIGGKIEFSVVSPSAQIRPGEKQVIDIEYRNSGSAEVFNAQARLSAVEPFTSSDDTAFLGNLKPGQSAVARFEVSVDGTATVKTYGLDSEIRYRDALDNPQISKTMKVEIIVLEKQGITTIFSHPAVLIILALGLLGGAYYIVKLRKNNG
jgi:hypothetical protein